MLKATSTVLLISVLAQGAWVPQTAASEQGWKAIAGGAHLHTRVITLSGLKPTEQEAADAAVSACRLEGADCHVVDTFNAGCRTAVVGRKKGSDGADRIVSISGFTERKMLDLCRQHGVICDGPRTSGCVGS